MKWITKMSVPRKHHYLPQFYLRGFSANRTHLSVIAKESGRSYGCAIRDAAAMNDFHRIDHDEAADQNAVEKTLAEIEGLFAPAFQRITASHAMSRNDLELMLQFTQMMRHRVPAWKRFLEEHHRSTVQAQLRHMLAAGEIQPPPMGLGIDDIKVSISNWKLLEGMFRAAFDANAQAMLARMSALLLTAPQGYSFLTSDQPVALFSPEATPHDPYGVGLVNGSVEVTIPLTHRIALRLSHGPKEEPRTASIAEVAEINRRTIVMAENLVFTHEPSQAANEAVVAYRNCDAGFEQTVLYGARETLFAMRFRPVMRSEHYEPLPR